MNKEAVKYLWDVYTHIEELEQLTAEVKSLESFEKNKVVYRATERLFEIIGEAVKKAKSFDKELNLTDSEKIIGMRNRISHGYDEVDSTVLYAALRKNIPVLKKEVSVILEKQNEKS